MTPEHDAGPVVVFRAGRGRFALPVDQVHEVLAYEPPRQVPGAPPFLLGVVEARGVVVPVFDLRKRLGAGSRRPGPKARILALAVRGQVVGGVVDEVIAVQPAGADVLDVDGLLQDDELRALAGEVEED
ncbi:MAG: chemotaxis protein CheW [Gemmatimonadota bacterium]|jgi:purine-binding chemotaxis protein CheW